MDLRPQFLIAACLALGLSGCYAPLQREHGYPADWPEPLALSKGFPEIDGTYANHGALSSNEGVLGEITLASLIPQRWTFGQPKEAVPNPPCTDCVVLRMRPGAGWGPLPKMRATLPGPEEAREFDVEVATEKDVLLYLLEGSGSGGGFFFSSSQTRVFLTVAADRSLIAKIHSEDAGLIVVVPYYSTKYTWARFERIGD
jgi:hypothetical protein